MSIPTKPWLVGFISKLPLIYILPIIVTLTLAKLETMYRLSEDLFGLTAIQYPLYHQSKIVHYNFLELGWNQPWAEEDQDKSIEY